MRQKGKSAGVFWIEFPSLIKGERQFGASPAPAFFPGMLSVTEPLRIRVKSMIQPLISCVILSELLDLSVK